MKLPNFSIRIILGAIITMMGLLALVLALLSGTVHRDLVLDNQTIMMQEIINISVKERIKELNRISQDLGLALQSTDRFKEAFNKNNNEELLSLLNNQFHQYFVTAGVIDLKQITLLDKNFIFLLESSDGSIFFKNKGSTVCPNLFNKALNRSGSERMTILQDLCLYENKPINVVAVPVGGLRLKGYLIITTDPTHNLSALDNDLGMPVKIFQNNEELLFTSSKWPDNTNKLLISNYVLQSTSGKNILSVSAAQNISRLSESLKKARLKVFLITGLVTLTIIITSIFIVRKTMITPLNQFTQKLRNFNASQPNIIEDSHINGTKEIHEICEGFNFMANAQYRAKEADQQKSRFLANMSHEIRTPLTAIIGFSERLFRNGKTKDWELLLKSIIINSKHLYQLINDILDLSKIEADQLNLEKINVSIFSLLFEIESLISEKARNKGLEFNLIFKYPLPEIISTDPIRLKQILINLCSNAIKFTEKGSVSLTVSYNRNIEHLLFSIEDSGIGIHPEKLLELFEPFTQADSSTTRKFGGTGLGLHISKLLTEKFGGKISASSIPNIGSRFEVSIPAIIVGNHWINTDSDISIYDDKYEIRTPLLNGNILLVEDNPDIQKLVSLFIEETGANLEIAPNGKLGIEKAVSQNFDLILMDMQMPEMGGVEAIKALRAANCTIPIAILTANAMKENITESAAAGANEFITKPINTAEFYSILEKYLGIINLPKTMQTTNLSNNEHFQRLFNVYINRLPEIISKFENLLSNNEWEKLNAEIHTLKGTGGTFGFPEITEQCANIERKIKNQDFNEAKRLIHILNTKNKEIFTKYKSQFN